MSERATAVRRRIVCRAGWPTMGFRCIVFSGMGKAGTVGFEAS